MARSLEAINFRCLSVWCPPSCWCALDLRSPSFLYQSSSLCSFSLLSSLSLFLGGELLLIVWCMGLYGVWNFGFLFLKVLFYVQIPSSSNSTSKSSAEQESFKHPTIQETSNQTIHNTVTPTNQQIQAMGSALAVRGRTANGITKVRMFQFVERWRVRFYALFWIFDCWRCLMLELCVVGFENSWNLFVSLYLLMFELVLVWQGRAV